MGAEATQAQTNNEADTAEFLALCARQLHVAVTDSVASTDRLVASVLGINRTAEQLRRSVGATTSAAEDTLHALGSLRETALDASMQLQSIDRLHQRLENVSGTLSRLSVLMSATGDEVNGTAWQDFLREARDTYTMESERQMFDAVFGTTADAGVDQDESDDPVLF